MPGIHMQDNLLESRYGVQEKPRNIIWNDTVALLLGHRSVRRYLPDALPDGAIETVVAAAQAASTSSNLHQWSVVAITDADLKTQVAAASRSAGGGNPYIEQAPVFLLWVADLSRNAALAAAQGKTPVVHDYLDALVMGTIDVALAAQNAAIAAESLGLGICYIGAMRNDARAVAELVGLPDFSYVAFGMVLGHPDARFASAIRPRPAQAFALHHNRYDAQRSLATVENYEAVFKNFRDEQEMKPTTWTAAAVSAATDTDYLGGRQDLRNMLEEAGFRLR